MAITLYNIHRDTKRLISTKPASAGFYYVGSDHGNGSWTVPGSLLVYEHHSMSQNM